MNNNGKNISSLEELKDSEMGSISGGANLRQKLSASALAGLAFGSSVGFAGSNNYRDYDFSRIADFNENEDFNSDENEKSWVSTALKSILGVTVLCSAIGGIVYLVNKIITATNFEEAFDAFDEIINNFENEKCSNEAILKACEEFENQILKELQKRKIKISKKSIDFKNTTVKNVLIYIKEYLQALVNNIDNNVKNENLKTKTDNCIVKLNQIIARIPDIPKQNTNRMSNPEEMPNETDHDDINQNKNFQRPNPNIETENVQPIKQQAQIEELEKEHKEEVLDINEQNDILIEHKIEEIEEEYKEELSLEKFTERFNNMCVEFCDKYCRGAIDDFSEIKPIFDKIVKFVEDYNPEFLFVWDDECIAGYPGDGGVNSLKNWKDYFPTRLKYVHDLERFRKETKMDDMTYRTTLLNFVAQFFWNINKDRKDENDYLYWVNDINANTRRHKSLGILIKEHKQQRPTNNEYVRNNLWNTVENDVLAFVENYYTLYFEGVDWSWDRYYTNERYEDSGMNLRLCVINMYNILTKLYTFPYAFDTNKEYDKSNSAVMYINIAQTLKTMHDFFATDVTFDTKDSYGEQAYFLKPLKEIFDEVIRSVVSGIEKSYPKIQSVARNGNSRMVFSPECKDAINQIEQEIKEVAEQTRDNYKYDKKYNDLVDERRINNGSSLLLGVNNEY